jgi:hypothetical protein
MISSRNEILTLLGEHREEIRRLGVTRLGLFGSGARDQIQGANDLDFVVEFERKSFDGYMDLKLLLEAIFGCRVDLVVREAIKPRLSNAILSEAVYAPGL